MSEQTLPVIQVHPSLTAWFHSCHHTRCISSGNISSLHSPILHTFHLIHTTTLYTHYTMLSLRLEHSCQYLFIHPLPNNCCSPLLPTTTATIHVSLSIHAVYRATGCSCSVRAQLHKSLFLCPPKESAYALMVLHHSEQKMIFFELPCL